MDNLQQELRDGVIYRQNRHSGDTHADLGGSINESKTDALMAKAADEIERLQNGIKDLLDMLSEEYTAANPNESSVPDWIMMGRALAATKADAKAAKETSS